MRFFPERWVDLQQIGDAYRGHAAHHGPDEKCPVAHSLLNPSCRHAWQHHPEGHESGADTVMRGAVFTFGEVYQIEHIGGEAEAVAKLFDEYADVDGRERRSDGITQIDEGQAG